jgi:Arc/MetJ-type ribon-helix-helix transcriptional regulator
MKLSVSLPAADVEFLDDYAHRRDVDSRSGALQRAVELLRQSELEDAYDDAWSTWEASGDAVDWDTTLTDGLDAVGR